MERSLSHQIQNHRYHHRAISWIARLRSADTWHTIPYRTSVWRRDGARLYCLLWVFSSSLCLLWSSLFSTASCHNHCTGKAYAMDPHHWRFALVWLLWLWCLGLWLWAWRPTSLHCWLGSGTSVWTSCIAGWLIYAFFWAWSTLYHSMYSLSGNTEAWTCSSPTLAILAESSTEQVCSIRACYISWR